MLVVAALVSASALAEEVQDGGVAVEVHVDAGAVADEPRDAGKAVSPGLVDAGSSPAPVEAFVTAPRWSAEAQAAVFVALDPSHTRFGQEGALRADGSFAAGPRTWIRGSLAVVVLPIAGSATTLPGYSPRDTGSLITLGFGAPERSFGELAFSLAPFGSQRIRPTFEWLNVWGRSFTENAVAPTFLASWRKESISVWTAFHAGNGINNLLNQVELYPGGLAGASLSLGSGWTLEARGAAYDRGLIPTLAYQGISKRVTATGVTFRLGKLVGGGVEPQWDPLTYAADPELFERPLARGPETEPMAATVFLEAGYATQMLMDPSVFAATKPEPAGFADLQARLRLGGLRLFATARWRTASLIQFDSPGFPPYVATSGEDDGTPELSAFAGAEVHATSWLTPSLVVRVRQPATVRPTSLDLGGNTPPPGFQGARTVVVSGLNRFSILPPGSAVQPWVAVTGGARFELSPDVLVLVNADLLYDPNAATFKDSLAFVAEPVWQPSITLSGSATLLVHFR